VSNRSILFRIGCSILLSGASLHATAQIASLSPVLISSAGGYASGSTMSLSYAVGEPVITTVGASPLQLTQGFEQPTANTALALHYTVSKSDVTCNGANDGTATAVISSGIPPFTFYWNTVPPQTTRVASGLAPGTYVCNVRDGSGVTVQDSVTVLNSNAICGIQVYSGFTPNGDLKNDSWVIDNIELYNSNIVSVYNRWGDRVWTTKNYTNAANYWTGLDTQGQPVPDGTYFYVIEIGANVQKGWVQVTR
jgi:gliding motility-associated-like protein